MTRRAPVREPVYGTRWGRALLAMLPPFLVVGSVGSAVATGVLTATYTSQASSLGVSVRSLVGGPAAIVAVNQPSKAVDGSVYGHEVLRIGLTDAQAEGLCATQQASMFGQTVTLKLEIPSVTVKGLNLDAEAAVGNVTLSGNTAMNINAADAGAPALPAPLGGQSDDLGITADKLALTGTVAHVQSAQLTSAVLPGLSAKLEMGATECAAPGVNGTGR